MTPPSHAKASPGIIPPLLTPLAADGDLDTASLERLIEHVIGGGCAGLFILGTTGEGPGFAYRIRRELIRRTCRIVAGRVAVYVGITDTCIEESLGLAALAADAGATAAVAAPPFYFPVAPPELKSWFDQLVAALPLPLVLYNMPSLTKVPLDVRLVRELADNPRVSGIKDSSGNMIYFGQLLEIGLTRPDWLVLCGSEQLVGEAVLMGGHGGVNGGANLFPALHSSLYAAAAAGDISETRRIQREIVRLGDAIYPAAEGYGTPMPSMKFAASLLGLCLPHVAPPMRELAPELQSGIREAIQQAARHCPNTGF